MSIIELNTRFHVDLDDVDTAVIDALNGQGLTAEELRSFITFTCKHSGYIAESDGTLLESFKANVVNHLFRWMRDVCGGCTRKEARDAIGWAYNRLTIAPVELRTYRKHENTYGNTCIALSHPDDAEVALDALGYHVEYHNPEPMALPEGVWLHYCTIGAFTKPAWWLEVTRSAFSECCVDCNITKAEMRERINELAGLHGCIQVL